MVDAEVDAAEHGPAALEMLARLAVAILRAGRKRRLPSSRYSVPVGDSGTWDRPWQGPFSAHPRIDPDNGDFYNLSMDSTGAIIAGHIARGTLRRQASVHQQGADTGRYCAPTFRHSQRE